MISIVQNVAEYEDWANVKTYWRTSLWLMPYGFTSCFFVFFFAFISFSFLLSLKFPQRRWESCRELLFLNLKQVFVFTLLLSRRKDIVCNVLNVRNVCKCPHIYWLLSKHGFPILTRFQLDNMQLKWTRLLLILCPSITCMTSMKCFLENHKDRYYVKSHHNFVAKFF